MKNASQNQQNVFSSSENINTRHLTTLDELKQNITLLACVEETYAPFISCYLNLEDQQASWHDVLEARMRVLRRILIGDSLKDLEEAFDRIKVWLESGNLLPEAKSVAIFVRGNFGGSFMLPMQFAAPLPNWVAIHPTPNIYHLVELKDNYHRYVVLLATKNRARILEVNLGAATIQAWVSNPVPPSQFGEKWSRTHYQINRENRGNRFLTEKIAILEQLMHAGGHTHLILAGDMEITRKIQQALPRDLADKLVDIIPSSERDEQSDLVIATLSSFIEHEEQESQAITEHLIEGLRHQNLAVAGTMASLDALRWGEVDILVMLSAYQPEPGWTCSSCKAIGTDVPETTTCPSCSELKVRSLDIKEALLRLAGQLECPVEIVEQSDALLSQGGVGCLLRSHLEVLR
jgi:rubrerythrin